MFFKRFILAIFLSKILFIPLNYSLTVNAQENQDKTIQFMTSSETNILEEKSRLNQSFQFINEMEESELKVILLNDLALNYAQLGDIERGIALLEQSLDIATNFEDLPIKIRTMLKIAKSYQQIGQKNQAIKILNNTSKLISLLEDKSLKGQLLLEISLKYGELGEEKKAQKLFTESQTIIAEASQPLPEFPFTETPSKFKLGISGNINSFRDTTASLGLDINYQKQWSQDDIFVDSLISIDYDSSRSVNNYRPGNLTTLVYRHHLNSEWNFFTDFFNSTNQDLYSSKNDDEDLTILSMVYFGGGLNLWREDSPSKFLDIQFGIGARYEYDYIDFEQRRNQADPSLGIILLGRGFSLGEATIDHSFAILPALNNFNNYILLSDTNFSIPLSEKWSLKNRLFARYRNELIFENNPKLEFFFSTGLQYEF